jgi:hypothetical protein
MLVFPYTRRITIDPGNWCIYFSDMYDPSSKEDGFLVPFNQLFMEFRRLHSWEREHLPGHRTNLDKNQPKTP